MFILVFVCINNLHNGWSGRVFQLNVRWMSKVDFFLKVKHDRFYLALTLVFIRFRGLCIPAMPTPPPDSNVKKQDHSHEWFYLTCHNLILSVYEALFY